MPAGATVTVPIRRCDVRDDFLRVVYADDQLVREEFDALIADVWGSHQKTSDGGLGNGVPRPPGRGDPRGRARTRTTSLTDPLVPRFKRQRSPP